MTGFIGHMWVEFFLLLCLSVVFLQHLEFGFLLCAKFCVGAVAPVFPVRESL